MSHDQKSQDPEVVVLNTSSPTTHRRYKSRIGDENKLFVTTSPVKDKNDDLEVNQTKSLSPVQTKRDAPSMHLG